MLKVRKAESPSSRFFVLNWRYQRASTKIVRSPKSKEKPKTGPKAVTLYSESQAAVRGGAACQSSCATALGVSVQPSAPICSVASGLATPVINISPLVLEASPSMGALQ